MNDLISRSALIKALKEDEAGVFSDIFCYVKMSDRRYVLANIERRINNAPTVEPVRGEWIYERGTYSVCSAWKCSNCGKSYGLPFIKDEYNFCPNCGCRMKD